MSDFPFTEDVVLLNSGDTARKGHYVEFGLHPHPDGWIRPGMANPFNEISQGREKGQRFRITVHLLADDETTTETPTETERPSTTEPVAQPRVEHRKWDDLTPTQQAGIRCNEPEFGEWLRKYLDAKPDAGVAPLVRYYCEVGSRAELIAGTEAGDTWLRLDEEYQDFIGNQRYRTQLNAGPR